MPQTVLSLVSTLRRGGPMHVLTSLLRRLDGERYRAVVATLSPEPEDSLVAQVRQAGIDVREMKLSRARSAWTGAWALQRLVCDVKPDLVHTHGLRADFLAARARLGCPIVSTLHCELRQDYGLAWGPAAGKVLATSHYALLRRFDGVAAVAQGVAEAALGNGVSARTIPNGIEIDAFCRAPDPGRREMLRAQFGWPADAVVVLHTGSLTVRKNPVAVVEGFCASALSSRGLLAFAGDGPLRAQLGRAAGNSGHVLFLGKRKDVADLLEAADLLVSSSAAEGMPMAVLEGCASGIAVLASDIPPHRAMQAAFPGQMQLFNECKELRAALDAMARAGKRRRFIPARQALDSISSRRMSAAYEEFYASLLRSKASETAASRKVVECH